MNPPNNPRTPPVDDLFADRYLAVETPEHVDLGFQLADIGSRFAAFVLDALAMFGSLVAVLVGATFVMRWLPSGVGGVFETATNWITAGVSLFVFVLFWGYFVFFEGLRDGQTPGKRVMGIRVVEDRGGPVDFRSAAIRGLLRVIDLLGFGAVGGGVAFLHPRTKRLGDLAAGTLVVRDRVAGALPEEMADRTVSGAPLLSDPEFAAVQRYLLRRETLLPAVRRRFGWEIAERLEDRVPWHRETVSVDEYLVGVQSEEVSRRAATSGRTGGVSREAVALVQNQAGRWREYRELLERVDGKGLSSLPSKSLPKFASLYREVAADLARARTYGGSPELLYALERMVASGHNLIYRVSGRGWGRFVLWLRAGFPRLVRRRWKPIAIAAALFYLPALVVYSAIGLDPDLAYDIVPVEMILRAQDGLEREAQASAEYVEVPSVLMPMMASRLISNNVQVTFMVFAGGITAGIGSLVILFLNGVMLGGVAGLYHDYGLDAQLWAFVLPHGVLELTAIVIAGGAALWMGSAVVMPGRRRRRDALVERAQEAISLMGGVIFLLVLAGLIEAFISPAQIPRPMKFAFASLIAVSFPFYLVRAGASAGATNEVRVARDV